MNTEDSKTIEKGIYRHNKSGNLYEVLDVAKEAETGEWVVVYRPKYEHPKGYRMFIRPYHSFVEQVTIDGKLIPRFEKLPN